MFWFIASTLGFVVCLVIAIAGSTAKPTPPPDPNDYGIKDLLSAKVSRDFEQHSNSVVSGDQTLAFFWVGTVVFLVGAVASGIAVFG